MILIFVLQKKRNVIFTFDEERLATELVGGADLGFPTLWRKMSGEGESL